MAFFLFIAVIPILAALGLGEYIGPLFVAYLFIGMGFLLIRDGEGKQFFRIFILPVLVIGALAFLMSQCDMDNKRGGSNKTGWWGNSNTCGKGSWFDKFDNGGGQWRNPDGKFCSR